MCILYESSHTGYPDGNQLEGQCNRLQKQVSSTEAVPALQTAPAPKLSLCYRRLDTQGQRDSSLDRRLDSPKLRKGLPGSPDSPEAG